MEAILHNVKASQPRLQIRFKRYPNRAQPSHGAHPLILSLPYYSLP